MVDPGTLLGGVAAIGTLGLGVYVQVIRRHHRRSINENRQRSIAAEKDATIAIRTSELQLQVWKELSDQLRHEVREWRDRAEKLQDEVSYYRTEVIGLRNWLTAKGIEWPDDSFPFKSP